MKKKLLALLVALTVVGLVYAGTWFRMYQTTKDYFQEAQVNYEAKKYGVALKGGTDFVTGEFVGSYQQVIDTWKTPLGLPKPEIYYQSLQAREEITKSLTVKQIDDIFKRYFKVDNGYLDSLLLQKAKLLAEDGDKEGAMAVYEELKELFPLNTQLQEEIANKQEELQ